MSALLPSDPQTVLCQKFLEWYELMAKPSFSPLPSDSCLGGMLCFRLCLQTRFLLSVLHLNSDNCGAKQKPHEETAGSGTGMERMLTGKTDRIAL